ncbi:type IV pilus modification protein PilV [Acinetobacter sp. ANC 4945]|uniref:Type IV pilus modification protein PilV n=1 Tax=Acinetobacter amyesii TaxID=2942470 RepID=A0A1T1H4R8_9GAMM|nr:MULTISPECIES: type IV pilus modification protein PilV [Acinetobacter]MCL6232269.1 type IV pilus modification protein PilV [Acinetobacter amyesii]MCL6246970.1 type IV pilus modification protein PilV [Acinetobacter amyesii]OOV84859.1 type IV pilus modification protein PilV [Acinetobacter amyesii]
MHHYISVQKGLGLMEVLVALLVLAIGVLGFIALQYRAIEASAESTYRVEGMSLARDFAERIRVNRGALEKYKSEITTPAEQKTSTKNCYQTACDADEMADFDVSEIVKKAHEKAMAVNLIDCQGNDDGRACIYVAWGETSPTNETDAGAGGCTNSTSYDPSSTCLIMEVY